VAAPFRDAEVDIIYGEGISREGDLLDLGSAQGVVEKSGSWFSYAGERLGQGRENARAFLKEHTEISRRIDTALREKIALPKGDGEPPKPPASEAGRATAQSA
jgi:recombination protein RecA